MQVPTGFAFSFLSFLQRIMWYTYFISPRGRVWILRKRTNILAGNGSVSKGNDPSSFIVQRTELYLKDRLMPDRKCNLSKEEWSFFSSLSSSWAKKKKNLGGINRWKVSQVLSKNLAPPKACGTCYIKEQVDGPKNHSHGTLAPVSTRYWTGAEEAEVVIGIILCALFSCYKQEDRI